MVESIHGNSDQGSSAVGLSRITPQSVGVAMQVTEENRMDGLEGRANLLSRLADALRANPTYFGKDARPGNLVGEYNRFPNGAIT